LRVPTRATPETGRHKISKRYGSSIFSGNKTGRGNAKKLRRATGLFPMCVAVPRSESRHFRPAGTRVALPGTNRHSQKAESSLQDVFLRPAFHFESANNLLAQRNSARSTKFKNILLELLQAVGKHLHGLGYVRLVDLGQLLQLAHTPRRLGSQQVALAGMHTEQFAGASDFETLGGAAMRL
jgi:hypothetical protein